MENFDPQMDAPNSNDKNHRAPCTKNDTTTVSNGHVSSRITVASIPRDVLLLIFHKVLHQHDAGVANFDSAIPTISYLSSASPIPLAHVCSRWRDVAVNSSHLWSEICIDHPRKSHIGLTKLWLERAQTHPLRLTVKTSSYLGIDLPAFTAILQLLVSKICQWREVDFDLPPDVIQGFSQMLAGAKMHLGQLESATISVHSRSHRLFKITDSDHTPRLLPIDAIWESIHSSPSLKSVNWKNLYEGRSPPVHTPWSRLTRLDLNYFVGVAEVLKILSMSPSMRTFRAEGSPTKIISDPKPFYASPIVHTSLHILCLTTTEDAGDFFTNIVLPELRKLHITYQHPPHRPSERKQDGNTSWSLADKFRHFLSESRCRLEDVWLNNPPYSDNDLCSHLCSPAFQSISRLRITGSNLVTDNVIQALTLKQGGVGILLGVKVLWLDIEETEITDGLISTMVASRWLLPGDESRQDLPVPLEEVRLTREFLDVFGVADREKLLFMLGKGLRVSISPGTLDSVNV